MATNQIKKSKAAPKSSRSVVVKARSVGFSSSSSKNVLNAFFNSSEDSAGIITPPFDFAKLYNLYEQSSLLRPCVEAYRTNIDSFGHHFTPSIDLSSADASTRVKDALLYESLLSTEAPADDYGSATEPTDQEVEAKLAELKRIARIEYARLESFFSFACPDMSFTELRRNTRQDLEVIGNAFWEIVRNPLGEIIYLYYVEPITMRLTEKDKEPTVVEQMARSTAISWRTLSIPKLFRRFVNMEDSARTYFKEFGDPRIISRSTGKAYESVEAMRAEEPNALQATEIMHFRIRVPYTPYGVPRWIPNLPGTLGSRELEEVNLGYFKNNVVPPLALLCSGGRLGKGVAERLEEHMDEHIRGRKGFHRILVLEAEGQRTSGEVGSRTVPQVKFVPLRDVQQTDAVFQEYDVRNEDKVAKSFRLPRLLRGDDRQINRSTSWATLKFAEEQVFEPEREGFDDLMNRSLLPALGISFWRLRSNTPITRDPEALADMIAVLVKVGVLLPSEARQIAVDIFNKNLEEISEDWTNKPLPYILAQLKGAASDDPLGLVSSRRRDEEEELIPEAKPSKRIAERTSVGSPMRSLGFDSEEDDE